MLLTTIAPLILFVAKVSAAGCKGTYTYGFCEPDRIVRYYDPEDGQICNMRDCGGGRAPPKTTDPCCGGYKGTETCNPNPPPTYLPCFSQLKASSTGKVTSSGSSPVVTTTSRSGASSSLPTMTSGGSASSGASASSMPTSGGQGAQSTSAPAGGNGTVTTGGITSAPSSASVSQSSSPTAARASNAAYALRYDLLGAFAGFVGANVVLV